MDLAKALTRNRFLVIGRAGMDLYAQPNGTPLEHASSFFACLGGSSGNIAAGIARHGGTVDLVTCVSEDALGRYTRNQLTEYGIGQQYVRTVPGDPRNTLAMVDVCGPNTEAVVYRNNAADFHMDLSDVEGIDFTAYDALITTGTVLASEPSRSATFHAFERAREAGLKLFFDVDYRPYSWPSAQDASDTYSRAGELCDVIIGNDVEFGFMAGDYDQGLEKARTLAKRSDTVVYKMGEKGAITITPDTEIRTGIYEVEALKPTGAGDSFMGGFTAALAAGHNLRDAVLRGSACASIVVSRIGCAPAMPTPQELDDFLSGHPGPTDA